MAEVNVNAKIEVTDKQAADIMSTALEGGIGYWCKAGNLLRRPAGKLASGEDDWEYDSFVAYDDEEFDEANPDASKLGLVTYDTIRTGIERLLTGAVRARSDIPEAILFDIVNDEMGVKIDAEVADVIVQAGLLNEIRYG